MKIGDLIKLKTGEEPRNERETGTILKLDKYTRQTVQQQLIEVLWNTGKIGWILAKRTEVLSEV